MALPTDGLPKTIVIAGASGDIGRALPNLIGGDYRWVALRRTLPEAAASDEAAGQQDYTWRRCDLFSRKQCIDALQDADLAVYLAHPIHSQAALTQGSLRDLDLLCADNFARAAHHHGLRQIVYLSGYADASADDSQRAGHPEIAEILACYGATVSRLRTRPLQELSPGQKTGLAARASGKLTRRDGPREVRSVQRLPLPAGHDARWVAKTYAEWLPRFMRPFIKVRWRDKRWLDFMLNPLPWPILAMEFDTTISKPDRQLYWIIGGLLAGDQHGPYSNGRLEFREVLDGQWVMAAIHNFRPRLPWLLYRFTQAKIHLFVMNAFARHLEGIDSTPQQLQDASTKRHPIGSTTNQTERK